MKSKIWLGIFAAFIATLPVQQLSAQNNTIAQIEGPIYVTTYVEVVPSTIAKAMDILKEYRDASRKEGGAKSIDILQEIGQTHRFVVNELWDNRQTVDAHSKGAAISQLVAKLKPIQIGPIDPRIHQAHMVTAPRASGANNVLVLSHVDVFGGNVQKLIALLNVLGEASRKDNGMVRYEILDEVPAHPNHFRVFEEWSSMAAWEAHNLAPHSQTYHEALMPMLGTPYDQRVYKLAN